MKNIITVTRLNDKARRIYELPEDVTLQKGTLVQVETRFGNLLYGFTATASALMDDTAVAMIRATLGMNEAGNFLKVKTVYGKAVYGEPEVLYPEDSEPEDGCGLDPDEEEDEAGEEE